MKNFPKVGYFVKKQITNVIKTLFIQNNHPATFTEEFKEAVESFTKEFLDEEKKIKNFIAALAFFKEHPDVNDVLFDYASIASIISRNDTSNEIPLTMVLSSIQF